MSWVVGYRGSIPCGDISFEREEAEFQSVSSSASIEAGTCNLTVLTLGEGQRELGKSL